MKIILFSTNRADYYKMTPVIDILLLNKINLYLILVGDDFNNINVTYKVYKHINIDINKNNLFCSYISNSINIFNDIIKDIEPNYIIIHGDRYDLLPILQVSLFQNINIIHIEGGEESGCIDDKIRNMISCVAKYHIVSNNNAKNNLLKYTNSKNIFICGCPMIDNIINNNIAFQELKDYINIDININDYIVFIFHLDTNNINLSFEYFKLTYNILLTLNKKIIIIKSNIESNYLKNINNYIDNNKNKNIYIFNNIENKYYLSLIKNTALFIGNSSSIVREAPNYGIPTILIGSRQNNRIISDNCISIKIPTKELLIENIKNVYSKRYNKSYIYGNGSFKNNFNNFLNNIIIKKI